MFVIFFFIYLVKFNGLLSNKHNFFIKIYIKNQKIDNIEYNNFNIYLFLFILKNFLVNYNIFSYLTINNNFYKNIYFLNNFYYYNYFFFKKQFILVFLNESSTYFNKLFYSDGLAYIDYQSKKIDEGLKNKIFTKLPHELLDELLNDLKTTWPHKLKEELEDAEITIWPKQFKTELSDELKIELLHELKTELNLQLTIELNTELKNAVKLKLRAKLKKKLLDLLKDKVLVALREILKDDDDSKPKVSSINKNKLPIKLKSKLSAFLKTNLTITKYCKNITNLLPRKFKFINSIISKNDDNYPINEYDDFNSIINFYNTQSLEFLNFFLNFFAIRNKSKKLKKKYIYDIFKKYSSFKRSSTTENFFSLIDFGTYSTYELDYFYKNSVNSTLYNWETFFFNKKSIYNFNYVFFLNLYKNSVELFFNYNNNIKKNVNSFVNVFNNFFKNTIIFIKDNLKFLFLKYYKYLYYIHIINFFLNKANKDTLSLNIYFSRSGDNKNLLDNNNEVASLKIKKLYNKKFTYGYIFNYKNILYRKKNFKKKNFLEKFSYDFNILKIKSYYKFILKKKILRQRNIDYNRKSEQLANDEAYLDVFGTTTEYPNDFSSDSDFTDSNNSNSDSDNSNSFSSKSFDDRLSKRLLKEVSSDEDMVINKRRNIYDSDEDTSSSSESVDKNTKNNLSVNIDNYSDDDIFLENNQLINFNYKISLFSKLDNFYLFFFNFLKIYKFNVLYFFIFNTKIKNFSKLFEFLNFNLLYFFTLFPNSMVYSILSLQNLKKINYNNFLPGFFVSSKIKKIMYNKNKKNFSSKYNLFYQQFLLKNLEKISNYKIYLKIFSLSKFVHNTQKNNFFKFMYEKYKYFSGAIGKGFFLNETLEVLWITFLFKDVDFFMYWFSKTMNRIYFKKQKKFLYFLKLILTRSFCPSYFNTLKFKGFVFDIRGKVGVSGNAKKRHVFINWGLSSYTKKDLRLKLSQGLVNTHTGVMGVTFIITY